MSKVGTVAINVEARTANFKRNVDAARANLDQNATRMQAATQRMRQGFQQVMQAVKLMAVAVAAGGAALAHMVSRSIESADQATKTAQAVGVTVETLTALQHAADLSGVSNEHLANSLKVTAQRAAEAARGSGEASRAYDLLGISVTDSNGNLKDSDELMKEVAEQFAQMEDGAGKTALAVQLFGRQGAALIPMLNQGRDGIEEMVEEAHRLGIVIDTETGQAAERFRDNLTRLRGAKTGLVNQITSAVLPTLEAYTDRMVESANQTERLGKASEYAATALKLLLSAGTWVKAVFEGVGSVLGGVAAGLMALIERDWTAARAIFQGIGEDWTDIMRRAGENIYDTWNDTAASVEREAPETGKKLAAPVMVAVEETEKALNDLDKIMEHYHAKMQSRGAQVFASTRTEAEQLEITLLELNELLEMGYISWDTYGRAVVQAKERLSGVGDAVEEAKPAIEELSQFQIQAYRSMQSAASDLFFKPWEDGLDGLLQKFLDTMQRIAAEWIATQAMMGLFGREFGKGGGLGGLLGIAGKFLGIGGSTTAAVKHSGGIIGEKGMTTIVPSSYFAGAPRFHNGLAPNEFPAILQRGEGVFTPGQMARLAPVGEESQTINNYFVISSPDAEGFDRLCQRNAISIVRATNAALEKNVGRKQMRGLLGG